MRTTDFTGIRLRLASPNVIHGWSHGEVTRPETINYRTQKPEKEGLFSEKIFGPSKDWECYCGKYKKIRYKGIVCDKCGVEVTRALVRRERMGHIDLAAPVAHIWFLRGVPSKIGIILDLSVQSLEKVIYFANFIITKVHEELREKTLTDVREEYKRKRKQIEAEGMVELQTLRKNLEAKGALAEGGVLPPEQQERIEEKRRVRLKELDDAFKTAEQELRALAPMTILTEHAYHDLSLKYGHVFEAGIGAEAVRELLQGMDIPKLVKSLEAESERAQGAKKDRMTRRLKLMKSFANNGLDVTWMILTTVPVIPPDLRPMVPLDGGRYATSDLNDLYRRVINRNNRLKQLQELNAPEVITRNEKRMLQEAVDALIDNSARHGKTVVASTGQKRMLKSIADMLKGKQGRFRQNLLGKRVDYSGRSVIVVGPTLKLHECGLPKRMALELFRPFIMSRLIKQGLVHNVRSAARFIDAGRGEIWDILEDIIKDTHVLLNRAPTLHRLGIQAFKPVLIEGKAIQVHPLVCTAFNADFDGDQMAVHIPLTEEAKREARELMLSSRNLLKPATGDPVATPNQDVVWGCYYMTFLEKAEATVRYMATMDEALLAYQFKKLGLRDSIMIPKRALGHSYEGEMSGVFVETSVGRLLFNAVLPEKIPYQNALMDKKMLGGLVRTCLELYGQERTATLLDDLKTIGFRYLTTSGLSWGIDDLPTLPEKKKLLEDADREIEEVQSQYEAGLLTESERHSKVISIWTRVKDTVVELAKESLPKEGSVYSMIHSGARGSWGQLTQIVGMKGLVTNPTGEIIELPVKRSFKEGFDVLEYFISTHGARKGLSDTALRTANAGYLTRRLVDVAQDIVVYEEDCGDTQGFRITAKESKEMGEDLVKRMIGRVLASDCMEEKGKKVLVKKGTLVTEGVARILGGKKIQDVCVRSLLTCRSRKGVCRQCYGYDLGFNALVNFGVAVGIIAAQSIGEPGTQLTMRTFHTGGVVGQDITQGLPRVEEIFEVRPPKKRAFIAEVSGRVSIGEVTEQLQDPAKMSIPKSGRKQKVIRIAYKDVEEREVDLSETPEEAVTAKAPAKGKKRKATKPAGGKILVKDGVEVKEGMVIGEDIAGNAVLAKQSGTARVTGDKLSLLVPVEGIKEYVIPFGYVVWAKDGDTMERGDQLTEGSLDLHQLYRLKGKEAVQKYVIKEIQYIYSSQGQKLNDKHVEVIARQMFSRVYVTKAGDTNLLPGEIIERAELNEENARVAKEKGEPAEADELLLGISKVSLTTRSFLSAASFQETARVLINAAITGKIDHLEGLKENVIIGRLIPAGTGFKQPEKTA